jgi:hypothetical protein
MESEEIGGKIFAIYFSPVFPEKFISHRRLKGPFKERLNMSFRGKK